MWKGNKMPDVFVAKENKVNNKKAGSNILHASAVTHDPPHSHVFASFCQNPEGFTFQTQKHNEVILLFLRRHFITNVPWILISLILSFIPILLIALNSRFALLAAIQIPRQFVIILTLFYYLILFSYVFINFLTWFYNVFLVTNERIVDVDYSNIVVHNVAETKVVQVEDVNYTQSGFIRTLFNYGDVFLQTAGTEMIFEALAVPKPREATNIIEDLIGKGSHES